MALPGRDPLAWVGSELDRLRREGLHRRLVPFERPDAGTAVGEGRRYVNLSSNDYLGVAADGALLERFLERTRAERDPLSSLGLGGGSSRLLAGHTPAIEALEAELAALAGREAALVFSSGYHANAGILPALAGPGDAIFSDALNHASLVDGCRLSGAEVHVYRHLDLGHLEELLRARRPASGRALVVTESLFSMDGDSPDLPALAALKERFGAALLVDEAHAVGLFGPGGAGLCRGTGVDGRVEVLVGTFGKALGSAGAFAACASPVKEYLVNRARTLLYTTAPPPAVVAWTRFVVGCLPALQPRRDRLLALAARFREALAARGLRTGGRSQIVPVVLGENTAAVSAAELLRGQGFLLFPIRPPTVPAGTARLRFSLTSALAWEELEEIPELLAGGKSTPPRGAS